MLQGNSIEDFRECLSLYKSLGYTYIAIPFHNRFLWETADSVMTGTPDDLVMLWEDDYYSMR